MPGLFFTNKSLLDTPYNSLNHLASRHMNNNLDTVFGLIPSFFHLLKNYDTHHLTQIFTIFHAECTEKYFSYSVVRNKKRRPPRTAFFSSYIPLSIHYPLKIVMHLPYQRNGKYDKQVNVYQHVAENLKHVRECKSDDLLPKTIHLQFC